MKPNPQRKPASGGGLFMALSTLMLLGSCGVMALTVLVFVNPGMVPEALRPAPLGVSALPATLAPLPTSTTASGFPTLPATWTPTATPTESATPTITASPTVEPSTTPSVTPSPEFTPTETGTPTLTPTLTPTPTATGPTPTRTNTPSPFQYTLQNDRINYTQNFARPTLGCNWQGIAGMAYDLNGRPVIGLLVQVQGGGLDYSALTGTRPEYGSGGYELFITDRPQTTTNTYRVQLRNANGQPLSESIVVPTFENQQDANGNTVCSRQLALVYFVQNR